MLNFFAAKILNTCFKLDPGSRRLTITTAKASEERTERHLDDSQGPVERTDSSDASNAVPLGYDTPMAAGSTWCFYD